MDFKPHGLQSCFFQPPFGSCSFEGKRQTSLEHPRRPLAATCEQLKEAWRLIIAAASSDSGVRAPCCQLGMGTGMLSHSHRPPCKARLRIKGWLHNGARWWVFGREAERCKDLINSYILYCVLPSTWPDAVCRAGADPCWFYTVGRELVPPTGMGGTLQVGAGSGDTPWQAQIPNYLSC